MSDKYFEENVNASNSDDENEEILTEAEEKDASEGSAAEVQSEAQENQTESSDGGDSIFAKLMKNRQARMDAVGDDDDYDIFDLKDEYDIDDDFVDDGFFDADPASSAADADSQTKKKSLFSKSKKDKPKKAKKEKKKKESKKPSKDTSQIVFEPSSEEISDDVSNEEQSEEASEIINNFDADAEIPTQEQGEEIQENLVDETPNEEEAQNEQDDDVLKYINHSKENQEAIEAEIQNVINSSSGTIVRPAPNEEAKPEAKEETSESESSQITLEAFENENIVPEQTSYDDEEKNLQKKRKNFADNFHLDANIGPAQTQEQIETAHTADIVQDVELQNGENVFDAVERTAKNKPSFIDAIKQRLKKEEKEQNLLSIQEISERLQKDEKKFKISIIFEIILSTLLLVFSVIVSSHEAGDALDPLFAHRARFVVLINFVLFALSLAFANFKIKEAIERLKKGIIGYSAAYIFFLCTVLLQLVLSLIFGLSPKSGYTIYTLPAALTILVDLLSSQIGVINLKKSWKIITKNTLSTLKPIEKLEDSSTLGYGLDSSGEPSIYFSADAALPNSLPYSGTQTNKERKKYLRLMAFASIGGVILTIISCIVNKSAMPILTVLPCAICICLPVARELVLSLLKSDVNRSSKLSGVTVLDFDSCDGIAKSNAIVVDIADIFKAGVSNYKRAYGCRMAMLDTVVYSASVLNSSKSILAHCFDEYIQKSGIELPKAEDFSFEDGLGFTAWVNNAKVIVGCRKCMQNHSIDCPTQEQEERYCKDGKVMYTAVENKIVATFIVSFSVNLKAQKRMQELSKTGIVLILNGTEPMLSEDDAATMLKSSVAAVKLISAEGFEVVDRCRNDSTAFTPGVLASSQKKGALQAVLNAFKLSTGRRVSGIILSIFCIISFIILALFGISKVSIAFTPLTVSLFLGFSAAISYFLSKLIIK